MNGYDVISLDEALHTRRVPPAGAYDPRDAGYGNRGVTATRSLSDATTVADDHDPVATAATTFRPTI